MTWEVYTEYETPQLRKAILKCPLCKQGIDVLKYAKPYHKSIHNFADLTPSKVICNYCGSRWKMLDNRSIIEMDYVDEHWKGAI